MKKRLNYIDLVKGISIITVIYLHSFNGMGRQADLIVKVSSAFNMSLFFICSGYFFNYLNINIKEGLFKRIKGILKPYVIWSLLIGFPFEMYRLHIRHIIINWPFQIKKILTGNFATFGCWFLLTLFVIYLIEYLITYICKKIDMKYHSIRVLIIHILLLSLGYFIRDIDIFYSYRIHSALVGTIFFYFGTYLKDMNFKTITAIIMLIIGLTLALINDQVKFYVMLFPNPIINLITALLINTGLITLAKNTYKGRNSILKEIELFGKNSIVVLITHLMFIYLIRVIEYYFYIPYYTFPPLITFLILLTLEYATVHYCPKFILKTFK